MEYNGRYDLFDLSKIKLYDLATRRSKVLGETLTSPEQLQQREIEYTSPELEALTEAVYQARQNGQPVIWVTGAHLIKNGFGLILADLVRRKILTLVGMNAAGIIHDLELALIGATSEDVPHALPRGEFGFARETGTLLNNAFTAGEEKKIGGGEAVGRLINGEAMPNEIDFPHRHLSLSAAGWQEGVPITLHASLGTDIIDQYPNFDPAAKGGCSGRDFLLLTREVQRMGETGGGVFLNVGTSVMGPEVFLKACSMAANVGNPPNNLVSASFDIRPAEIADADDERKAGYYFRDIKSVVVRIPSAFGGKGYYVQGDHLVTLPAFYQHLVRRFESP
jgi:hypothetical protein